MSNASLPNTPSNTLTPDETRNLLQLIVKLNDILIGIKRDFNGFKRLIADRYPEALSGLPDMSCSDSPSSLSASTRLEYTSRRQVLDEKLDGTHVLRWIIADIPSTDCKSLTTVDDIPMCIGSMSIREVLYCIDRLSKAVFDDSNRLSIEMRCIANNISLMCHMDQISADISND